MKLMIDVFKRAGFTTMLKHIACFLGILLIPFSALSQDTGSIKGVVSDSLSGEKIFGANAFITELSKGAATDDNGEFEITNIPVGSYDVRISYLGYKTKLVEVTVTAGAESTLNIVLESDFVEGEEIQVLAQAAGQVAAIKEQMNSNTIVNVVSKERLEELPDQNAAESVARLPGVSVQRDAGEASKVVVRGLSPRFNSITVNGVRMPGTEGDRSVDLSLLPSDVLDGIQVYKALTPDKDADAVGGTVNLLVKRAPSEFRGNVSAETGYNDIRSELGQYKFSTYGSNRFFDDKLGVLVSASIQRANRGSKLFDIDPEWNQSDSINVINNLNFADNFQVRDKYGLSTSLDYQFNEASEVSLSTLFGRTDRDEQRYRKRYRVGNTRTEYDARDQERYELLYTNVLTGRHELNNFEIDWQGAYSFTLAKQTFGNYARFYEVGAYDSGLDETDVDDIIAKARNNLDATYFLYGTNDRYRRTERDLTVSGNLKYNFQLNETLNGYLKAGGKVRKKDKDSNDNSVQTDFGVVSEIGQANQDKFDLYNDTHIAISNFINEDYDIPTINGYSVLSPRLDMGGLNDFYNTYSDFYGLNRFVELEDYEAGETVSSAYVMGELEIGPKVTFLPGVRYEYVETFYEGNVGNLRGNLGQTGTISDTTGGQNYGEIFPQFHLKLAIVEGIDLRFAYTHSLSRPDYNNLVPYEQINEPERQISRGNPNLKHSKAINYDAFISFYNSRYGFFSAGVFYKEIEDVDYLRTTRITEGDFAGYELTSPVNANGISTVRGVEFDLQTDFKFLPKPLNGLILSTNIAFIKSETFFPVLKIGPRSPEPPFRPTIIDTVRSGKLPGQPDVTASFTLGYEIGLFSARASLAYQQEILEELGSSEPVDQLSRGFSFWDIRVNQSFAALPNLTAFLNINNLTSEVERDFIGAGSTRLNTQNFTYGLTGSIGVKYKF
jgi:TonB-dependent receptor